MIRRLALACLIMLGACGAEPPRTHQAVEQDDSDGQEELGHPIDVAGHLAIAASSDMRPLRGIWRWGTVPVGITVGPDGSVLWAQYRTDTIERADPKRNDLETIAAIDGPLGLAVDGSSGDVFYTTDRDYPRSIGVIRPGEHPVSLVHGMRVNRPFAIAVAERNRRIYWTESINGRIRTARTDGKDLDTVFDDGIANVDEATEVVALSSTGIAVAEQPGFIFWSDLRTGTIERSQLDGSERRTILGQDQGLDFPTGLALDAAAGKLYWADPGTETISRADLDGSNPEVVASAADGVLEPYGLAVDPQRRVLYWTDVARNAIYRTHLDAGNVEIFVDLDAPAVSTSIDAESPDPCRSSTTGLRRTFLRRWVKQVRTCVLSVSATKAVMRSPTDLKLPARTCGRQLLRAHEDDSLRAALTPDCDARLLADAIETTLEIGAQVVATDLPRSASYLRAIRPFVAKRETADEAATTAALAAIDALVKRLDRLERSPASTVDWTLPASGQITSYSAATRLAGDEVEVPDDGTTRAGAPLAYVDNGDGTMSDRNTGLMWEKKCNGCGGLHDFETRYAWHSGDARTDVSSWLHSINEEGGVGLGGHHDWRIPEIGELLSVVDFERFNPTVDTAFDGPDCGWGCSSLSTPTCSCTQLGAYWTAGNSPRPDDVVPVVGFNFGAVFGQRTDSDAFARAVRGPTVDHRDRFVDNGDGTVTDRTTRLMWEKKFLSPGHLHDVDRHAYWSFDGTEETIWDWLEAINAEGDGGFAGHDDWRVPNVKELFSLFDPRHRDPSIAPEFAGEGCADLVDPRCSLTSDGLYWTSTTFADFPALALAVGFSTPGELEDEPPPWVIRVVGGVEPHLKTLRMAMRAVRGPVPADR